MAQAGSGFIAAIDAFFAAPKRLAGSAAARAWQPASVDAQRMVLPLQIGDEIREHAVEIFAYPEYESLKFHAHDQFSASRLAGLF